MFLAVGDAMSRYFVFVSLWRGIQFIHSFRNDSLPPPARV